MSRPDIDNQAELQARAKIGYRFNGYEWVLKMRTIDDEVVSEKYLCDLLDRIYGPGMWSVGKGLPNVCPHQEQPK